MAAISGWLVELDSRASLQYDYSVAFLIMAVCWGLDLVVVAGLNVPETRGVSTNPWAEVTKIYGKVPKKALMLVPTPFYCPLYSLIGYVQPSFASFQLNSGGETVQELAYHCFPSLGYYGWLLLWSVE